MFFKFPREATLLFSSIFLENTGFVSLTRPVNFYVNSAFLILRCLLNQNIRSISSLTSSITLTSNIMTNDISELSTEGRQA